MPFTLEGNTMTIRLQWLHFVHSYSCCDPSDWLSSGYVAQLRDRGGARGGPFVQQRTSLCAAGVASDVIWSFSPAQFG